MVNTLEGQINLGVSHLAPHMTLSYTSHISTPRRFFSAKIMKSPGWVAHLIGEPSYTPKGCGFDSIRAFIYSVGSISSWDMMGGNQLMFLTLKSINTSGEE